MQKTILITGATSGIGKLAALQFAKAGHSLLLHGRNSDKLNAVKTQCLGENPIQNHSCLVADLSKPNDVFELIKAVQLSKVNLDVIVNNAGVYNSPQRTNDEGLDLRFMVNYLAPYLLTKALLPQLSTHGRIINLSSAAQSPVNLSALNGDQAIPNQTAYAESKLALTMWSFYLSQQIEQGVIAVNPGSLLDTKMVHEAFGRVWGPASKGADIIVSLSTNEEFEGISGKYFDNDLGNPRGDFGHAHPDAYDEEKQLQLIQTTQKITDQWQN